MKVVIIGLGSIARKHIHAIRSLAPETQIYALRTSNRDTLTGVTNLHQWSEINFAPDFIIVSNPTSLHFTTIRKALEYKCPLFIEKPSVATVAEAEQILDEVTSAGAFTYIGCDLRFHACVQWMRDYIRAEQPRVNEVNIYCGSYLPEWRPGTDFRTSYSARPELGGGVHLDLIHEVDYHYWLFGKPEAAYHVHTAHSSLAIPATDYAHYMLKHSTFTANITLNYFRRDTKRFMEVVTDRETLTADLVAARVESSSRGVQFSSLERQEDIYRKQMADFIHRIQSGQSSMHSFRESVDVLRVCLKSTAL